MKQQSPSQSAIPHKGITPYKYESAKSTRKTPSENLQSLPQEHYKSSMEKNYSSYKENDQYKSSYTFSQNNESERIMQERSNNELKTKNDVMILHQQKQQAQVSSINDPQISLKMENYYKSNPLNAIPENWEMESKTSGMYESQSLKKMNASRLISEGHTDPNDFSNGDMNSNIIKVKELPMNISDNNQSSLSQKKTPAKIPQQQESKIETKKDKVEAIKARLKQLYLNYCDYSLDNGNIYITFTNFMKLMKDAQIFDESVNQNIISLVISKECNVTSNMIKHISFEQFLNSILRISELKYPDKFKKYPKSALKAILKNHVLPLLKSIEQAVENHSDEFQYSLYTVSELTLKLIVYNEDTQVIFSDIIPIIKMVYQKYFDQETLLNKNKQEENLKLSLRSVMHFVRDFELCPYLVHQKACFLIWYSIAHAKDLSELTNNTEMKHILAANQNVGKQFTLGHFIIFLYRLGVIYFNHSQENPQDYNLIKKLLFFLRKLENSDGFKKFMKKLNRTYNDSLTFLPSKELLLQILKAEGINDFTANTEEYYLTTKDAMISRIIDNHLFEIIKKEQEKNLDQSMFANDELYQYLQNTEDDLKKLFEIYCSYGDPMNTKFLKSSKLMKMFRDCGLLKQQSRLPINAKNANQLTTVEIDLAFKSVIAKGENFKEFNQFQSQMSVNSLKDNTYSSQISGFLKYQSQMQTTRKKSVANNNTSMSVNNITSFDIKSHLLNKNNANTGKLDFQQFKQVLEVLSTKVYPQNTSSPQSAYTEVLKTIIIPQLKHVNNKRCIHNNKISNLLMLLDNQDMINLLTILHRSIIDIYRVYADQKGYMNFQQFINYCTDFEVFPIIATKATLYRIFHSLSFMNDALASQQKQKSQISSTRLNSPQRQQQQSYEMIDEHLFVESLALVALYSEDQGASKDNDLWSFNGNDIDENNAFTQKNEDKCDLDDTNESTPIEKVLQLIEKMANSEGVHRKMKKGNDVSSSIKCNLLEKKDLLELFRVKYPWYFKTRYIDTTAKKKNFQDIMEMSSIMTEASQLEI